MKNLKKVVAIVLTAAIAMTMGIAGTVAYLTKDLGSKTNTFKVGELDVYLSETTDVIGGGERTEREDGADYSLLVPGDKIVKEVKITNKGNIDAYVKVTVTLNNAGLINKAIDQHYEGLGYTAEEVQAKYDEIFDGWHINYNPRPDDGGKSATGAKNARGVIDGVFGLPKHALKVDFVKTTDYSNDTFMFGNDNWFMSEKEITVAENGGYSTNPASAGYYTAEMKDDSATEADDRDYRIVYTYYLLLPADENQNDEEYVETVLFNGFNIPMEFNSDQLKMFDGLVVDIKADAVQADNFENAQSAFLSMAVGDGTTVVDYYHKVANADELVAALNAGEDVSLLKDLINVPVETKAPYGNYYGIAVNGNTLNGGGKNLDFDEGPLLNGKFDNYGIMTSGGTIEDVTITGVFRGIMIMDPTEDVIIDNVIIGDEDVCYAINTGEGDGTHNVIVKNSTIKGWSSYGTAVKSVSFTNCKFAQGEYYTDVYGRLVKPYVDTVFENCEFDSKFYIDLSQLGKDGDGNVLTPGTKITLKNCTVNGVKLTAENWTSLIASENDCGESQISIEGKDGSYMTATNVFDYVVIE